VALLASSGSDLDRKNYGGSSALHLCCQNGHNQSCRELLLAGCDPDVQNNVCRINNILEPNFYAQQKKNRILTYLYVYKKQISVAA